MLYTGCHKDAIRCESAIPLALPHRAGIIVEDADKISLTHNHRSCIKRFEKSNGQVAFNVSRMVWLCCQTITWFQEIPRHDEQSTTETCAKA